MWRRFGLVLPLIGCAGQVTPQISNDPGKTPLQLPHESYSVVPAELGDVGVEARIHHRARVPLLGKVWFGAETSAPLYEKGLDRSGFRPVRLVIGETQRRLRIALLDYDTDAHYAVWTDRAGARQVALVESALDGDGRAVLLPGAGLELGERHGDRRHVELVGDPLAMAGEIETRRIGTVWIERAEPAHAEATRQLAADTEIHAAPNTSTPPLATTTEDLRVAVVGSPGAWTEIDAWTSQAHVRGFVPAATVTKDLNGFGYGRSGMGISDTDHVIVAAGACLFDAPEGNVVGVNVTTVERYAYRPHAEHPGWWTVFVASPWGSIALSAHQRDGGAWESCAATGS